MDITQLRIISAMRWSSWNKKKLVVMHVAFLLLFPGYFFYETLLGVGAIDPFLGGYFSIVSVALLLPLMFFYILDVERVKRFLSTTDFYFFLFIGYFLFIIGIHFFTGADSKLTVDHLSSIIHMVNLFIIFKALDFRERTFRLITMVSLVGMSAIVFYFSIGGFFDLKDDALKNAEMVATYQGFARSYLLTFIVAIAFYRAPVMRYGLYALAAATLFVNGARSEFAAMIALVPLLELIYAKNKTLVLLVMGGVLLVLGVLFNDLVKILPENRILELADLSQSTSVSARHYLTGLAWNTIVQHPILGDYGSYAAGGYAHNILSAWVDLGLAGFVYLLMILLWPALQLFFTGVFQRCTSREFVLAASLLFITILLLVTSHYFTDMAIGAALGAYARYRYGNRSGYVEESLRR